MKVLLRRVLAVGLVLFLIAPSMRTYGKDQVARLTLDQAIKEGINNNRLIREAEEQERAAIQLEKRHGQISYQSFPPPIPILA